MCEKLRYCNLFIDVCLRKFIKRINRLTPYKTIASCCGHQKYKPSVVIRDKSGNIFELFSRLKLEPKVRNRYYVIDKQKYYFIPELS